MGPMDKPRRVGGLKLAAGVGAATVAACAASLLSGFVFVAYVGEGGSIQQLIGAGLAIGGLVAFVALIVCPTLFLVVGLPLYALSTRKNWVSLPAYTAAGFATSVLATFIFGAAVPWRFAVLFLLAGGTAATVAFWLVVRPDRSQA